MCRMPDSDLSPLALLTMFLQEVRGQSLDKVRKHWPDPKSLSGGQRATWSGGGNGTVETTKQQANCWAEK